MREKDFWFLLMWGMMDKSVFPINTHVRTECWGEYAEVPVPPLRVTDNVTLLFSCRAELARVIERIHWYAIFDVDFRATLYSAEVGFVWFMKAVSTKRKERMESYG